jgi:hypothetical protein
MSFRVRKNVVWGKANGVTEKRSHNHLRSFQSASDGKEFPETFVRTHRPERAHEDKSAFMLQAASPSTLAKSAGMGHPRFGGGKRNQSVGKAAPPA